MTADEFNEKYGNFLEEGHYGLAIDTPEIVQFLDDIFIDLVKIPGFTYSQIKLKFGYARFYADGIHSGLCYIIENTINSILKSYESV